MWYINYILYEAPTVPIPCRHASRPIGQMDNDTANFSYTIIPGACTMIIDKHDLSYQKKER
jgi:hypothetical protein